MMGSVIVHGQEASPPSILPHSLQLNLQTYLCSRTGSRHNSTPPPPMYHIVAWLANALLISNQVTLLCYGIHSVKRKTPGCKGLCKFTPRHYTVCTNRIVELRECGGPLFFLVNSEIRSFLTSYRPCRALRVQIVGGGHLRPWAAERKKARKKHKKTPKKRPKKLERRSERSLIVKIRKSAAAAGHSAGNGGGEFQTFACRLVPPPPRRQYITLLAFTDRNISQHFTLPFQVFLHFRLPKAISLRLAMACRAVSQSFVTFSHLFRSILRLQWYNRNFECMFCLKLFILPCFCFFLFIKSID